MRAAIGILFLTAALAGFGQTQTATITVTITNSEDGGNVAGAAIEVKNSDTGIVYQSPSDKEGRYEIANLPPATYQMTITVLRFKRYVRLNIKLSASQVFHEDVKLQPLKLENALAWPSPKDFGIGTLISIKSDPELHLYEYTVWNGVGDAFNGLSPTPLRVHLNEKVKYAVGDFVYIVDDEDQVQKTIFADVANVVPLIPLKNPPTN
jgi:carboxypeptidase family protein